MTVQTTLRQYLLATLPETVDAQNLRMVIEDVAAACIDISMLTRKGRLSAVQGKLTTANIQGETQIMLDVASNDLFLQRLSRNMAVSGLASEEMEAIVVYPDHDKQGYLVMFDPLDGSSNVDVNVTVGSIFSIIRADTTHPIVEQDFLKPGAAQVAAGYAAYGPSTMLVISVGQGTHGFTLDEQSNTFILTHADMQIPVQSAEYAINSSNERFWEMPVRQYIRQCKAGSAGSFGRDFNMRWVGSLVADVHRILTRGGIYLYPKDHKQPAREGRLRLMYECNPMSMLVIQAGGASSTGEQDVMAIQPTWVHQRVPLILGSKTEVEVVKKFYSDCKRLQNEATMTSALFHRRYLFKSE